MSDQFVGEIRLFGGTFAPVGWLFCQGQTLPISQYETLFSLIGTTYGGDGMSYFQLPDLRGRVPVHQGNLSGGGVYTLGQTGGAEMVTLNASQLGGHNHTMMCTSGAGASGAPGGKVLGHCATPLYTSTSGPGGAMNAGSIGYSGGSVQGHENRPPYLALNFIIAYDGIYPSHS